MARGVHSYHVLRGLEILIETESLFRILLPKNKMKIKTENTKGLLSDVDVKIDFSQLCGLI